MRVSMDVCMITSCNHVHCDIDNMLYTGNQDHMRASPCWVLFGGRECKGTADDGAGKCSLKSSIQNRIEGFRADGSRTDYMNMAREGVQSINMYLPPHWFHEKLHVHVSPRVDL